MRAMLNHVDCINIVYVRSRVYICIYIIFIVYIVYYVYVCVCCKTRKCARMTHSAAVLPSTDVYYYLDDNIYMCVCIFFSFQLFGLSSSRQCCSGLYDDGDV